MQCHTGDFIDPVRSYISDYVFLKHCDSGYNMHQGPPTLGD